MTVSILHPVDLTWLSYHSLKARVGLESFVLIHDVHWLTQDVFLFFFFSHTPVTTFTVRTPATSAHLKTFRSKQTNNDVVQSGGWYALEQKATNELAARNFAKLRPNLPTNLNVVECGGWYALQQHAADPKGALMAMIQSGDQTQYNLQAITALLLAMGKGFDSNMVDGEWTLLLQRQGGKSPKIQKLVGKAEKIGSSTADFNVKALEFYGKAKLLKYGLLQSTVSYRPVADAFEGTKTSIILRRIACDIIGASWKFGRLPRLPLPLRSKGGYLDFIYLDGDIRVTKGNRGGLFVHGRPSFVQKMLS
jgi:hypothetical protein